LGTALARRWLGVRAEKIARKAAKTQRRGEEKSWGNGHRRWTGGSISNLLSFLLLASAALRASSSSSTFAFR
jgi:hypothetical protein